MNYGIHWFRRDLRIVGNPALEHNLEQNNGRTLGVFCFDRRFLSRDDFSNARFLFFLKTLENLQNEMRERGGDLLFLDTGPDEAFAQLHKTLSKHKVGQPSLITWNRDYEPFARDRDARLENLFFEKFGWPTHHDRDHLLIEPKELFKDKPGSFYQIYTPFSKKWKQLFLDEEINTRLRQMNAWIKKGPAKFDLKWPKDIAKESEGLLESYIEKTSKKVDFDLPTVGFEHAKKLLRTFKETSLENYEKGRDIPSEPGTSKMSIYLKNGTITVPQIICFLKLEPGSPHEKYFNELIWREFYYHILYHRPDVEHTAFQKQYKDIKWENNKEWFKKWCEGKTGYPIVDAGMRQLNATGWMHNRVRMIVSSFLMKDLLIDYRWGEKYFMEKLLDGDLAPNNGGWQWAASTGCDAQPYFRVFNPTLQAERFDPDLKYIKKWAPEYHSHEPQNPMVDHAKQKNKAVLLFKAK